MWGHRTAGRAVWKWPGQGPGVLPFGWAAFWGRIGACCLWNGFRLRVLKCFCGVSDGSRRRGTGGEKSLKCEKNTPTALAAFPGALQRQGSLLWRRPCADFQRVTNMGTTVSSLSTGDMASKVPAVSNVNDGVLDPPSSPVGITYWTVTVPTALEEVSSGFAVEVDGTVSIFQGETDKYKMCPKPKQNTGDRDPRL